MSKRPLENSIRDDIQDLHHIFNHPVGGCTQADRQLRIDMMAEEQRELETALRTGDRAGILHESVDVIVLAIGNLVAEGLPFQAAWDAIHVANMSKIPSPDGGKALKPDNWQSAASTIAKLAYPSP